MIRSLVGHAFLRWGMPGALCALLAIGLCFWWLLTALWWVVEGAVFVVGAFAFVGYLLLLIFLIRWFRGRRSQEHLLGYGRRGWLE